LTVFPELGQDVVDSVTNFFDAASRWIESADPTVFLEYFTDTASEYIVPLLGLGPQYFKQASRIMTRSLSKLFPDLNKVELTSLEKIPHLLPNYETVQASMMDLMKDLSALKLQETVISAFAPGLNSYMNNGKSKKGNKSANTGNTAVDMASGLFNSFMNGGNEGKEAEDNDSPKAAALSKPTKPGKNELGLNQMIQSLSNIFGGGNEEGESDAAEKPTESEERDEDEVDLENRQEQKPVPVPVRAQQSKKPQASPAPAADAPVEAPMKLTPPKAAPQAAPQAPSQEVPQAPSPNVQDPEMIPETPKPSFNRVPKQQEPVRTRSSKPMASAKGSEKPQQPKEAKKYNYKYKY